MEARKPAAGWKGRRSEMVTKQDLIDSTHELGQDLGRALAALATAKDRLAESKAKVKAQLEELGRLREALDFYANPVNWWWDSERNSWIWMGDNHPDMTARRVLARQSELAGEFTGKIETVKLYPGKALTPDEIFNDY